ncbi:hypothetical protein FOMPIDRAFT_91667 [Fomitopsis schrenkii]|uniref:Uncharacterized protein n=1 Tax=Fomitopsis schrenkii TaxID=2126942 RepID=S8E0F0_FOMSC|nr:hypothetical protein FOMPIDRAFT_91667 [Fomitopsis schrenkii]
MDAPLQVDYSATIQGTTAPHIRGDEFLTTSRIRVADTQEFIRSNRDEVQPAEDAVPGGVADTAESRASISPAMRRHIEALQMEMARLTSTVREVMVEAEMGGLRGPPPAYEEDMD